MTLYDVLFNWLQLKLVMDDRPHDQAAIESLQHVEEILKNVHGVDNLLVSRNDDMYTVQFNQAGTEKKERFTAEAAETLIRFIHENPERYDIG